MVKGVVSPKSETVNPLSLIFGYNNESNGIHR